MVPDYFRNRWGFAGLNAAPVALLSAAPALSAPLSAAQVTDMTPLTIALGTIGFGLVASVLVRRAHRRGRDLADAARQQLSSVQAELDLASGVLDGLRELTLVWRETDAAPTIYGQTNIVQKDHIDPAQIADFRKWLTPSDGAELSRKLRGLKTEGRPFDLSMVTLDGQLMRLAGRVVGGAAVLRVRPATAQPEPATKPSITASPPKGTSVENIFGALREPAWCRNVDGAIYYANAAYWALAENAGSPVARGEPPEIFTATQIARQCAVTSGQGGTVTVDEFDAAGQTYDLVVTPLDGGIAGFFRPREADAAPQKQAERVIDASGIIDAIDIPIAIFNGARKLRHFNKAYANFWGLDQKWLATAPDEGAVLDHLRREGRLPSEADYRAWRARHLSSYTLTAERSEPWYLPDGQVLNAIAVPAGDRDGVIYVFDDITEKLALKSRYNALIGVQSETLSALSEGVAVFGTNGRLTLHNPRLSALWKLPMNTLGQHPHIDEITAACAQIMPEDGARIWGELKQSVVNLNPARSDQSDRISRADGRLIDYSVIRLPDGQTMMTFIDVTEGANYQRVLKERNDALVTADRLKDAFVQNVSYELRSPLTNIIGFADLLASGGAGELNEKQRDYTRYIRASSETLGVLIDNILDLATVDAGISELKLEEQDISALIERARAGLVGTLTTGGAEPPPNLVIDIAPDLPSLVADGTRIVQVLYNLLSNAVRFSAPGARVWLTVTSRGGRVVFSVEDEGVGISEEVRATMFQRFEGRSADGRQRGAGLGLSIVKTFVNLHGGTVTLEQREPRGTRVIVAIPAQPAVATGAAE